MTERLLTAVVDWPSILFLSRRHGARRGLVETGDGEVEQNSPVCSGIACLFILLSMLACTRIPESAASVLLLSRVLAGFTTHGTRGSKLTAEFIV